MEGFQIMEWLHIAAFSLIVFAGLAFVFIVTTTELRHYKFEKRIAKEQQDLVKRKHLQEAQRIIDEYEREKFAELGTLEYVTYDDSTTLRCDKNSSNNNSNGTYLKT